MLHFYVIARNVSDEAIWKKGRNYCEGLLRFPFAMLRASAYRNDTKNPDL